MKIKKFLSLAMATAMVAGLACVPVSAEGDNTLTCWTWDKNFNIFAMEKAAEIYRDNK